MLNSYNYLVKGVLYVCVSCNPKLFIILSEKKPHKRNVYKLVCILKSLVPPPPQKKIYYNNNNLTCLDLYKLFKQGKICDI